MPSIGPYNFISVSGHVDPAGRTVEDITAAGVDGLTTRVNAKRGGPSQLIGFRDHLTAADAYTALENYKRLIGTTVSITDGFGVLHTNVMVLAVSLAGRTPALTPVGGLESSPTLTQTTRWTVQATDTVSDS